MKPILSLTATVVLFAALFSSFQSFTQPCNGGFADSTDNLTVYITNEATGSYNWIMYAYGDNDFDINVPSPTHTYAQPGVYEVCQIIQDTITGFCFDYVCDTLFMGGATCQANFWYFSNGLEVEFTQFSLGTFDSLLWDFGDGNNSNDTMPIHTYSAPGVYEVCLSIFDQGGQMCDSMCMSINVDSAQCEADFTHSANNLDVQFTNTSSGNFNAVFWDFGDGFGSSEDLDPQYTYLLDGTYTVCLSIFDTLFGGCWSDVCLDVTVSSGGGGSCNANFTYETDQLGIVCNNISTGSFMTSVWDFGDGSNPKFDPEHTYSQAGTYEVCLTIGNLFPFCTDQHCETVTVFEETCEPTFEYSFNNQNIYSFINTTSVGNVTSVLWEFGDGNTSTFASPSYTYNEPGNYIVCLTTFDDGVECGSTCEPIEVYPLGIESVAEKGVIVFPNPAKGSFHISGISNTTDISLFDIAGRQVALKVLGHTSNTAQLETNAPAGTYVLHCMAADGSPLVKLIVIQ